MTEQIPWNTGDGNITLTYNGQGNDSVIVASDINNLNVARSQILTFTGGGITRQVTVRQEARPLPYDTEIEYLESTSEQLINTGVNGGTDVAYEIEFTALTQTVSYAQLWGSSRNENFAPKVYCRSNTTEYRVEWYFDGSEIYVASTVIGTNAKHKAEYKNGSFFLDDTLIATPGILGFGSTNFCLFGYLPEPNLKSNLRLYSCKIWVDGVLLRDMIPVRLGQVGYLYDKVSGQLFGNDGTGNFILGPDKAS